LLTSAEVAAAARPRPRLLAGWEGDAMFGVYADHRGGARFLAEREGGALDPAEFE
jgi:hypothetical protein